MKKKYIIIPIILLGIIFLILFIFLNNRKIFFSLDGPASVEVNVGEEYKELGINAKYCSKYLKIFCKDIKDNIKTTKRVIDSNRYFINYILEYKNDKKILTREILLVDKESPVIKLSDSSENYCPNNNDFKNSYSAYDNVDGDITDKVITKIIDKKIYFSVEDSSGNKKVIYRDLEYIDTEAPNITLNGTDYSYVYLNQEYIDKGVNVSDNCDIDITKKLKVTNNVNTKETGEYDVIYTVADSNNNISTLTRKVIVYKDISEVEKNGKIVYLTFDDGPCAYTEDILKVLDKYNVKATFFVTNQFSNYNHMIKTEHEKGHSIAVHTYSHNYKKIYSSFDNYLNDFYNINEVIYEQTGTYSKIYRFPGGSSNTISRFNKGIVSEIATKMNDLGYKYFDWNVDSMDTSEKDPNKIFNYVKNGISKEDVSVVLMHDIKKANIESVDKIIKYGLDNGYTFLPLDENSPEVHHSINN